MYESKRRGKNRIVGYQARTERIVTAVDIEVADERDATDAGRLGPPADVRTGGDPAPWGQAPGSASSSLARPYLTEFGPGPAAQPPEPAVIPVEPGVKSPAGPGPSPGSSAAASHAPTGSAGGSSARSAASAGSPGVDPAPKPSPRPADAPWLTRVDDTHPTPLPPATQAPPTPPSDTSSQRPAADLRSVGGTAPGRASGQPRSNPAGRPPESAERPWIALPIEPWEPPERPKG
jgi:hypothetical protein